MATAKKASTAKKAAAPRAKKVSPARAAKPVGKKAHKPAVLPKSDGPAGVKADVASMEPWQAAIAKRADAIIAREVPDAKRAIRWRCPFYGIEDHGWFLAFAAFQYHVKFTFFKGDQLKPEPPVASLGEARSLDVREGDPFDEKRFATWVTQAAGMPGWLGH